MSTPSVALQPPASHDLRAELRIDLQRLYASLRSRLERTVGQQVQAPQAVIEDACQIAWIRLIRHADRIHPDSAFAWLAQTARREARRELHRRRREVSLDAIVESGAELSLLQADAVPSEQLEHREQLIIVGQLPARQQRIAWLRATGLSHAEISQRTGDSGRTIERQLARGRARLRDELAA